VQVMADTKQRWACSCGSFRFKVAGVDRRICQQCGMETQYFGTELWFKKEYWPWEGGRD
jgi:ribosomal protein S27AE